MDMKIMGMKRSQSFETVQDIWSTEELADPALGVWLKRDPPTMGNVGIEKVIAAEMSKMKNHDRGLRVGSDDRLAGNLRDSGRL
jgi:hypothetical protein